MNPLFAEDAALAAPLRSLVARLRDTGVPHLVLAIADNDAVRQEATAEMGERLSGSYRLAEFDYTDAPLPSLPRYYRQLAGDPPVCLFGHGLDVLKARDTDRYEEALHFLNAHREDLRLAPGAMVLWLTTEIWEDVQEKAPDFADWESASAFFVLPPDQRVERTPLGRLSISEAEDLRRQVAGFHEMLARPNLGPALEAEFKKQLDLAERQLGRVADVRRDYRLHLVDELREHVLRRFAPQVGGRVLSLPLAKIFLPLRALEGRPALAEYAAEDLRWQETAEETSDLDWRSRREEMEKRYARLRERQTAQRELTLRDLLKERRTVLLGDPGTGKTTVCRYVAWALAADDETHIGAAVHGRLPVLVRLADFGKALEADPELTVLGYVSSQLLPKPAFGACLRAAIEVGECLVILDGLDEITDPDLRAEVTARIQAMVTSYGANHYLVTSRIVGYERSPLTQDFRHATLRELEDADRKRFVKLWYAAIGSAIPERSVVAAEAELIETLEKQPPIARMAANPLLLTIMVLMHWRGIKLPNRRVQVYQIATDTLIEYWTAERVTLDAEEVKQILAPVAHYILSSSVGGVIARRDLLPRLRDGIIAQRGCDLEAADRFSEDLLMLLGEQSGIFLERGLDAQGQPVYGFLHQTFGEYFAALQLANEVLDGSFEIERYVHRSTWHEPLLLLAGHLSLFSQAHASLMVRAILDYPCPYEKTLRRNVLLAAECLADDVQVTPALRDEVLRKLAELLLHPASQPQQAALEVYQQLGRTRHRAPAAATVKALRETLGEPDRLRSTERPTALVFATALVRLGEREAAEPLLVLLEDTVYDSKIRNLRLEGWPEDAESLLLKWKGTGGVWAGSELADSFLWGVDPGTIRRLLGPETFCRFLERALMSEECSGADSFVLRWLLMLASDMPSKETLLSLTTNESPLHIRILAAKRLLETEHRSAALDTLRETMSYDLTSVARALLEADQPDLVDWGAVRDCAFMPYASVVPGAIGLLLRAGKLELALSATFHLIATDFSGELPWLPGPKPFVSIVERLASEGQLEVARAVARWLALWPGYQCRFEACEALIGAGGVDEAITLLKFIAYECHGEASQKACQRLLMLKEPDPVLPILTQLSRTAPPDLQYEASRALALVYRASIPRTESSRIELKTLILDERLLAYRTALDKLYEVGMGVLGEPGKADHELEAATTLGRLSLVYLCGRGSLREKTASLPEEINDVSMMIGANLALFECRGGHLDRAMARMNGLAAKHGFNTRLEARPWTLSVLARIHGHKATTVLDRALRDRDPRIRVTAVESLGELMPEDCSDPLFEALGDSDAEVRAEAASMLGKFRFPGATEVLIKALRDESASVRRSAAEALGLLRATPAVQALSDAVSDDNQLVREAVIVTLSEIGHPSAVPAFITALSDKDPSLRRKAIAALTLFDNSAAARALIAAIHSSDSDVFSHAVAALAQFPMPGITQRLMEVLSREDEARQRKAAIILAQHGNPAGADVLTRALGDKALQERALAAEALGVLRIPSAAQVLLMYAEDEDSRVRAAVTRALGNVADPAMWKTVLSRIKDENAAVRCAALDALKDCPEALRTEPLLNALKDIEPSVRLAAAWGLSSSRSPAAAQGLLLALHDEHPDVRRIAAYGLGEMDEVAATPSLILLLGDENHRVRTQACRALGRFRNGAAVGGALRALLNDSEGEVRAQAVIALGRRRDLMAFDQLLTCLRDQHMSIRRFAGEALGRFGLPNAIEPLMATAVEILGKSGREIISHDLPNEHRDTLASIAKSLARLNARDALQFLATYAIPDREYVKSLVPLDATSTLQVLDRFANPLRDQSWPHWLRGHALWRLGRLSEARSSFRQAAAEKDVDSLLSLALFDLERNNPRGSIHHVDQALERDSERPINLLTRAVVLYRRRETGKALDSLEHACRNDPDVTDAQDLEFDHLWRGEALAALSELLAHTAEYEMPLAYSEVAEPQARYDPPTS